MSLVNRLTKAMAFNEAEDDDRKKREDEDDPKPDDDFGGDSEEDLPEDEPGPDSESDSDMDDDFPPLDDEDGGEEDPDLEGIDDFQIEDDSEFGDEEGELGDVDGDMDGESDLDADVDGLISNEPPSADEDPFGDSGVEATSDFKQFITNQLIDFPVEDVRFEERDGARYIDAKFGDKAVSICLYSGDEGQPLLAILYGEEVYRTELPSEAVTGDGQVRDEFMPVDFIRDMLSRIVDVAPEFECYRFKTNKMNCVETRAVKVKRNTLRETINFMGDTTPAKHIDNDKIKDPKGLKTNKVVTSNPEKGKTAELGAPGKTGGIDVPGKSGGKAQL